jgi:hypothetical protein
VVTPCLSTEGPSPGADSARKPTAGTSRGSFPWGPAFHDERTTKAPAPVRPGAICPFQGENPNLSRKSFRPFFLPLQKEDHLVTHQKLLQGRRRTVFAFICGGPRFNTEWRSRHVEKTGERRSSATKPAKWSARANLNGFRPTLILPGREEMATAQPCGGQQKTPLVRRGISALCCSSRAASLPLRGWLWHLGG